MGKVGLAINYYESWKLSNESMTIQRKSRRCKGGSKEKSRVNLA